MAIEEFKDVIRIEEVKDGLSNRLRRKQLGFERFQSESGVEVRMGYLDSTGALHYFNKGGEGDSCYWKKAIGGIYNSGPVLISNSANENSSPQCPLEVGSAGYQIRVSSSSVEYAELGMVGSAFRVNLNGIEKLELGEQRFKIYSPNARVEYIPDSGIQVDASVANENISLQTTSSSLLLGDKSFGLNCENAEVAYDKNNGEIRTQTYLSGEKIRLMTQSSSLHLTDNTFRLDCSDANVRYTQIDNRHELMLETSVIGDDIRLKTASSGNIILEPGIDGYYVKIGNGLAFLDNNSLGCIWYHENGDTFELNSALSFSNDQSCKISGDSDRNLHLQGRRFVDIQSNFLKLPVKTNAGHPEQTPPEGCMYVNKAERRVWLYIDGGYKQVLAW